MFKREITGKPCGGAVYTQNGVGQWVPLHCTGRAEYRYVGSDDEMPAHVCESCKRAY